ncbi:MAG: glycosyltransferase family 2 protein [Leptospiraceae bacterium]|nr:glycosyltransferase family 2 protein [Leptospiraceae bacterium]
MKSIPGLSACIITLNEEGNLGPCLESLDFAEEILVIDSGSVDSTEEIARSHRARWFHRDFDNYVAQKNFAIEKATGPWILFLDADERVSADLRQEIQHLFDQGSPIPDGYAIPRRTFYLGRWIRFGGWYPDYTIRLFRKDRGRFYGKTFHEKVRVTGPQSRLRSDLLHYSYRNIQEHIVMINRYSDLFASERIRAGKRNGVLFSLLEAIIKFLTMYVWKGGFLDGRAGLVIAVLGAYYNFLKYIKVWEKRSTVAEIEYPRKKEHANS